MEVKRALMDLEQGMKRYRMVIGLVVIILLITLIFATFINFKKQNEIIEKGGFIDGNIKCVCTQEAWDQAQLPPQFLPDINITNG